MEEDVVVEEATKTVAAVEADTETAAAVAATKTMAAEETTTKTAGVVDDLVAAEVASATVVVE